MLEIRVLRVHLGRRGKELLEGEGNYENFIFFSKCCWGYDVKEDEIGWVCSTYRTDWRFAINLDLVHKRNIFYLFIYLFIFLLSGKRLRNVED